MRTAKGFCRMCQGTCGVVLQLDDKGQISSIQADRAHPLTKGHACFKGLQSGATHNSSERIIRPKKRMADGSFGDIPIEDALDEISVKLATLLDRYGPDAIATYMGGPSFFNASVPPMISAFNAALGTGSFYSSMSIDQPGKAIMAERLGYWNGGRTPLEESDVAMLIGTNPMVSSQTIGLLTVDPVKRLKRARARGMKLIVVDPRQTETAAYADLHLMIRPGSDVFFALGFLNEVNRLGYFDSPFCEDNIRPGQMDELLKVLGEVPPDLITSATGIARSELARAAEMFARPEYKGCAFSGTGPAMGPHSSVAEHLIEAINVVCGRYMRAGDTFRDIAAWLPLPHRTAEPIGPLRSWESLPPARNGGVGALMGQKLTGNLAADILLPGPGQVRAIINDAGNLATAVPNQREMVGALQSLDLLVSIEPFMTTTARLSHYIFAPKLQYERDDLPVSYPGMSFQPEPWAQYQEAVATPPDGADLIDDWQVFSGLAQRLGLPLIYAGTPLDPESSLDSEKLLQLRSAGSAIPFSELRFATDGRIYNLEGVVGERTADAGWFDPMPDDVAAELRAVIREAQNPGPEASSDMSFLLIVRRQRDLLNAQGLYIPTIRQRAPYNPLRINPSDMTALGLNDGDKARVGSSAGSVTVIVEGDTTLPAGTVSLTHGWGGLPGDDGEPFAAGTNVNRLVDRIQSDPLTAIARMTAVPVTIVAL